eukprot:364496-Chlamydomonas_euryale.AAC.20
MAKLSTVRVRRGTWPDALSRTTRARAGDMTWEMKVSYCSSSSRQPIWHYAAVSPSKATLSCSAASVLQQLIHTLHIARCGSAHERRA